MKRSSAIAALKAANPVPPALGPDPSDDAVRSPARRVWGPFLAPVAAVAGAAALVAAVALWPGGASELPGDPTTVAPASGEAWSSSAIARVDRPGVGSRMVRAWARSGEIAPVAGGVLDGPGAGMVAATGSWFTDAQGRALPLSLPAGILWQDADFFAIRVDPDGGLGAAGQDGSSADNDEPGFWVVWGVGLDVGGVLDEARQGLDTVDPDETSLAVTVRCVGENEIYVVVIGREAGESIFYLPESAPPTIDGKSVAVGDGELWCGSMTRYEVLVLDSGVEEPIAVAEAGLKGVGHAAVQVGGVDVAVSLVSMAGQTVYYAEAVTDDLEAGRAALEALEVNAAGQWVDAAQAGDLASPAAASAQFKQVYGEDALDPVPTDDPVPSDPPATADPVPSDASPSPTSPPDASDPASPSPSDWPSPTPDPTVSGQPGPTPSGPVPTSPPPADGW